MKKTEAYVQLINFARLASEIFLSSLLVFGRVITASEKSLAAIFHFALIVVPILPDCLLTSG